MSSARVAASNTAHWADARRAGRLIPQTSAAARMIFFIAFLPSANAYLRCVRPHILQTLLAAANGPALASLHEMVNSLGEPKALAKRASPVLVVSVRSRKPVERGWNLDGKHPIEPASRYVVHLAPLVVFLQVFVQPQVILRQTQVLLHERGLRKSPVQKNLGHRLQQLPRLAVLEILGRLRAEHDKAVELADGAEHVLHNLEERRVS